MSKENSGDNSDSHEFANESSRLSPLRGWSRPGGLPSGSQPIVKLLTGLFNGLKMVISAMVVGLFEIILRPFWKLGRLLVKQLGRLGKRLRLVDQLKATSGWLIQQLVRRPMTWVSQRLRNLYLWFQGLPLISGGSRWLKTILGRLRSSGRRGESITREEEPSPELAAS